MPKPIAKDPAALLQEIDKLHEFIDYQGKLLVKLRRENDKMRVAGAVGVPGTRRSSSGDASEMRRAMRQHVAEATGSLESTVEKLRRDLSCVERDVATLHRATSLLAARVRELEGDAGKESAS